ncbi:hypothetical protein [Pedobacter sp. Hv1]|uniref:hypothetical protein n=1 Tax=Pedobacter sp. Hv1 TaxID=1740090 RepID=UPI0006D8C8AC|nr:hypothetical protein [Pedobacter sp. Hv1]KQC01350.1 hypothetical protein AQF98_06450 [Pedobacter sp. Hv1]
MKKTIYLITFLTVLVSSCKKELRMSLETPSATLLDKTKQFYDKQTALLSAKANQLSSIDGATGTKSKKKAKFPPLWENAQTGAIANDKHIISVPLAVYQLDVKDVNYIRKVVFTENEGEITAGKITEVFASPEMIAAHGNELANGQVSPESIGFTGSIVNYNLEYKEAKGKYYKNGVAAKGEVSISEKPAAMSVKLQQTKDGSSTNKAKVSAISGNDRTISAIDPVFDDGENCDNVYEVYIEKDASGNVTYWEMIRFLYRICTGGPVVGAPPGGRDVYVDCFEVVNGEAYNSDCGCIGGTTGVEVCVPTEQQIKDALSNKPFALFGDVNCEILKKWIATAKFTPNQSIISTLNHFASSTPNNNGALQKRIAWIQNIDDAYSTVVNMDYYSVTITQLPIVNGQRLGPGQFLNYIRKNLNSFTDGSNFSPYNAYGIDDRTRWNSTEPLGSIIAIDMPGPENGSVITSYSSADKWTFTTIHEPKYGDHPVSGNRNFGYTANDNGSYTFYTQGVDRLTSWDVTSMQEIPDFFKAGSGIPFSASDALWTSFQNAITNFVKANNGSASVNNAEIKRPNWDIVKDVMAGRKPYRTLSKDCKD